MSGDAPAFGVSFTTENVTVECADGVRLDTDLLRPSGAPIGGIVVAHPHPLYGGNRHHPMVRALTELAATAGYVALRFDFRGTGRSTGTHGKGVHELLDMRAALTTVGALLGASTGVDEPILPMVAAGYSFGAVVALGTDHPGVTHRVGVAAPLGSITVRSAPSEPTLLFVPRHDQYSPPESTRAATADWPTPPTIEIIEGCDHFLTGFETAITRRAIEWLLRSV